MYPARWILALIASRRSVLYISISSDRVYFLFSNIAAHLQAHLRKQQNFLYLLVIIANLIVRVNDRLIQGDLITGKDPLRGSFPGAEITRFPAAAAAGFSPGVLLCANWQINIRDYPRGCWSDRSLCDGSEGWLPPDDHKTAARLIDGSAYA